MGDRGPLLILLLCVHTLTRAHIHRGQDASSRGDTTEGSSCQVKAAPRGQEAHDGSDIDLIWSECESCRPCPLPEGWTVIEQWLSGGFSQETVSGQAGPAANNHLLYKSAWNELLIYRVEAKSEAQLPVIPLTDVWGSCQTNTVQIIIILFCFI